MSMNDLLMLAVAALFAASSWLLVALTDRLLAKEVKCD